MRVGQTSAIVFASKLLSSVLGFVATIYFARVLGAEVLGIFAAVITVANWLRLAGSLGVGSATTKRISEGREQGAYVTAGFLVLSAFFLVVSVLLFVGGEFVDAYFAAFRSRTGVTVVRFLVLLFAVQLLYSFVTAVLDGQRLVHVTGLLDPVRIGSRSALQILLVALGFGLVGMVVGYAVGALLTALAGVLFVSVSVQRPRRHHFVRLVEYARYSWLGRLKSQVFNDVDILVLYTLVPAALVGIYSVAWSLATFLSLFGNAITVTLFPEISRTSSESGTESVANLVRDATAYTGLLSIPGVVGGTILADRLLRIYGPEFVEGSLVLVLLLSATLVNGFQKQFMNALNGIDRPDVSFRINAVVIVLNLGLNVVLVWLFGWVGAAVATVLTALLGTTIAYVLLSRLVPFRFPRGEVGKQIGAAVTMGGVVYAGRTVVEATAAVRGNVPIVLTLVGLGAATYFGILLVVSPAFRSTVSDNVPTR